ncbi:non-homologous end-joining factor 1-like [Physella acuta]|uniref:non-homologous end-joining factor 1-like n=1 Tax=Physella acuta TaxID=109671 RepID=UPI0027DB0C80|nr:non-homologous end-joining factor 1-like [Physella acuta]XP_059154717.1 non-homologous end-joining factor 1-like [Physella acuta]
MASELQWRRNWKPNLASCPWKQLSSYSVKGSAAGDSCLLIKSLFGEESYELLITDLTTFWHETLSVDSLKSRINKLNPHIEAPIGKILNHIKENILHPEKSTQMTLEIKGGEMILEMKSQMAGIPFLYRVEASLANHEMSRDHLTVPLMLMTGELFRQRMELFNLLTAKDKEIADYKSQGVKVSRKYMETLPFDELVFQNNMVTSKGFEDDVVTNGSKSLTSVGQDLYREIITKRTWLLSSPSKEPEHNESLESGPTEPSVESWSNRLPSSMVDNISPIKSNQESPKKVEASPIKDSEQLRREALERKLAQEEAREKEKRKKKKLKF